LAKLPIWQRRERLAPREPLSPRAAKAEAAVIPSPEPTATPEVKAAFAPKLTLEQVREKWWWFLTALAFAECFASILAGAVLAGVWEWDRDHDGIPDHMQRQIDQTVSQIRQAAIRLQMMGLGERACGALGDGPREIVQSAYSPEEVGQIWPAELEPGVEPGK
jgi:hypothetical protein